MKRLAALILVLASTVAWSMPVPSHKENRSIGENGKEARRAAKQQQKYERKQAKRQQKAMKKYQKQLRKQAKQQNQHRHK